MNIIHEIFKEAEDFRLEPPRPLRRQLPPAEPYPVDALGDVLAPAARAIHARIQAPMAICAQAVLGAATLCGQGYADVQLPFGQRRPLSCYLVSIAESGERKTSADAEALGPVRAFEQKLQGDYEPALAAYQNRREVWEKVRREILGSKNQDRTARERALDELGPSLSPPLISMLTCPEPTFEGLTKHLVSGLPSLGLFSAEGGQFLGGYGMSADQRLKTSAGLSSLWDGDPLRRVRAGDGSYVLHGRRLALHLMVQPAVATLLVADRMLADQGLLSRILVVAPESTAGSRFWREPPETTEVALRRYYAHLLRILEEPLPLKEGTTNELAPEALKLTPLARGLWISFSDHIEQQLGKDGHLERIRAFAAKAAEHAARLGAVLAVTDDLQTRELDHLHLAAGIELVQHYLGEWLRLHDAAAASPELIRAEQLQHWLNVAWAEPLIALPEIYQRGPNALRDAQTARQAAHLLAEHGWLIEQEGGAVVDGTFRREAWRLAEELRHGPV